MAKKPQLEFDINNREYEAITADYSVRTGKSVTLQAHRLLSNPTAEYVEAYGKPGRAYPGGPFTSKSWLNAAKFIVGANNALN